MPDSGLEKSVAARDDGFYIDAAKEEIALANELYRKALKFRIEIKKLSESGAGLAQTAEALSALNAELQGAAAEILKKEQAVAARLGNLPLRP